MYLPMNTKIEVHSACDTTALNCTRFSGLLKACGARRKTDWNVEQISAIRFLVNTIGGNTAEFSIIRNIRN